MSEQDRDQRTEAPTAQRLRKAVEEGQIGFSSEFMGGILLLFGVLFFWLAGAWMFAKIADTIRLRSTVFHSVIKDVNSIENVLMEDFSRVGLAVLGLLIPLSLATVIAGGVQTNFNISSKPLELKWNKLSVVSGFRRMFSMRGSVRGLLALCKASAIVLVAYLAASYQFEDIVTSGSYSIRHMLAMMCRLLLSIALWATLVLLFLGIIDLGFQKWKHLQDMKMSLRDIRDENKENEGDPLIRARVKRIQMELSRQRMMNDVPKASVVITNPTHFAVAIQYDKSKMAAPQVVAKGGDMLAKKIIELARENGVPVVQRKPLARYIYFNVKIGQPIPVELYEAVAKILNFIYSVGR